MPIDPKRLAAKQDNVTPKVETYSLELVFENEEQCDELIERIAFAALEFGCDDLYNCFNSALCRAHMLSKEVSRG